MVDQLPAESVQSIMDRTMKAKMILSMALLSGALAACGKADKPAEDTNTAASQAETSATANPDHSAAVNGAQQTAKLEQPSGVQDAKQYLCQGGGSACKASGPLVANSDAEAKWLLSNGYPTEAELARLDKLSLDQLKAESQAGNKAATVIYGKKTATSGHFQEGLGILRNAASSGNLYSYYGLSDIYASETKDKNLIDSAAYLRLAYLLGDGKASADIALRGLSSVESVAADERAASLYKTFSKYQRPSPRPVE
ncbi:hypothetical protein XcuCFBP2542_18770 [Xanthomonas cucurbitae]|uniref:Uncharacterized protein n=2 Tax=Xanthomonas TaxID=338 RepID=A0A2S7D9G8_9XANT|nr:hypothetical protein XcuCFBP2542_18770 [Xanthomonas cucurbitae]QHG86665.1 hypothetical protein EBN15_06320 [Xanthomonas cucurbitae]